MPLTGTHSQTGGFFPADFSEPGDQRSRLMASPAPKGSLSDLLRQIYNLPASVILSTITINLLSLALPLVVVQIFDRVIQNQSSNTLILLLAGLFLALAFETYLRLLRRKLVQRVALQESFDLNMRLASRILYGRPTVMSKLSRNELSDAMTAADEVNAFLGGSGRLALLDFPFIFIFLGIIAVIAGQIVLVPIFLILVFIGWTYWSSLSVSAVLKDQITADNRRYAYYSECLKGIITVKSLALEPRMMRRLEAILQKATSLNYQLVLQANRMTSSGQLFANLIMISIVSVGGLMVIDGDLTIGALAACTLISNRIVQPVMRIIGAWGQLASARMATERYSSLLALPLAKVHPAQSGAIKLAIDNIRFPGNDKSDSSDERLQLSIDPGEIIGIVYKKYDQGQDFVRLLQGVIKPETGLIAIDDLDIAKAENNALQSGFIYIGNSPVIFRGSILDNISMFGCVNYKTAILTTRTLGLEPVIHAFSEGYDTHLDDISATSQPEDILRAICITRAVAMRPRGLILDVRRVPPYDISTKACARAIEELRGKTTIVILGKYLSELEGAERIFTFDNWQLRPIFQRTQASIAEENRKLIAGLLDLKPE